MQMNKSHRADKSRKRSRMQAMMARARAWGANLANAMAKRHSRVNTAHDATQERARLIGGMTNWQRNQAGRKCKGAWDSLSIEQLRHFAALPHWKRALRS